MSTPEKTLNQSASTVKPMFLPVKFIFKRDDSFPTFHADGAWGLVNNHGNIQLNFYIERAPLPNTVINQVNDNGFPIGQSEIIGIDDKEHYVLIRDLQAGIILSSDVAKQVHAILGNFIRIADETEKTADELRKNEPST